jgi:hypothetical protein
MLPDLSREMRTLAGTALPKTLSPHDSPLNPDAVVDPFTVTAASSPP